MSGNWQGLASMLATNASTVIQPRGDAIAARAEEDVREVAGTGGRDLQQFPQALQGRGAVEACIRWASSVSEEAGLAPVPPATRISLSMRCGSAWARPTLLCAPMGLPGGSAS